MQKTLPPRVVEAERFLARRGWTRGASEETKSGAKALVRYEGFMRGLKPLPPSGLKLSSELNFTPGLNPSAGLTLSSGLKLSALNRTELKSSAALKARAQLQAQGSATWLPLGPVAVQSQNFGLVTGRVSALALDPSDATGNTLYVGTTGGGVWRSQNAGTTDPANIVFIPLTDNLPALNNVTEASISIGALAVQPGGTGVILAGTGDPNDALDSYYGAGILRSADGGGSWSLISTTADQLYSFVGEGFAGFAWSTVNSQLVVAAVSQAFEGTLVDSVIPGRSYEGLYYSSDGGATWSLATITDGAVADVQGPNDLFAQPDGNAATSVVWNPVRQLFMAAVRYHGYYQSVDGITWTRMTAQPGAGLTAQRCPANYEATGSPGCPIFRGTLSVNPQTGDTFAWTVDIANQDQGIWQDLCAVSAGACASPTIWTAKQIRQWDTTALETDTIQGPATIANGDYNLALVAVPAGVGQQYGTVLLAGANDLWKTECPYSQGCDWRNTTNSTVGFCAQVGEYQHSLAWNAANPLEILVGNDSGLWRSTDAIGETGQVCSASDAAHFQNLNGSLGSLAEVVSLSQAGATPYTMMASLGADGTAGVKATSGSTAVWPEILGGEGGPVAIDPGNSSKWYVNNRAGVSIYLCSQQSACTTASFGSAPVVNDADVGGDGLTMSEPAPFLVDPLDPSHLLVGTCRVWRGGTNGAGWTITNAISPMLDGSNNPYCNGDALIRSMAAAALPSGKEVIYVGMYGAADGGATAAGHILSAVFDPAQGAAPVWTDLTLKPVVNDTRAMNHYGLDISSIVIDSHDSSGNTVYVTVAGIRNTEEDMKSVYGSTDGGAHWTELTSNLIATPVNSLSVDPLDASTVYLATDAGVFSTRQISNCTSVLSGCWSAFGSGLPEAPVVAISAAPANATVQNLVAATYGRGIWMAPLWTAGEVLTMATATPGSLTFNSQTIGSSSPVQTVTVTNNGTTALTPTSIVAAGDFGETDNCLNASVAAGSSCAIQVMFTPTQTGNRTGALTIGANVSGGELTVSLGGTGAPAGTVSLSPASIDFGSWVIGTTSTALQVTASNIGSLAVPFTSGITGSFAMASNSCGASIPADGSCNLTLTFTPSQTGPVTGALTFIDSSGTQAVALSGSGLTPPTDDLSPTSMTFPATVAGQFSAAQTVTLTNNGGALLTSVAVSVSGSFQQTNACNTSIAPQSSCAIRVVFAPTQAGGLTGTLTVSDLLHTQTVALSGTGIAAAAIGVSPASLTFSSQQLGVASAPQALTVSNTGGSPMGNVGFQISGLSAASFATGPTSCGATLAGGASCTVQVTFTPAAAGGANASLVVSSSTSGVAPVNVPLAGTELSPAGINVNPAQLVFAMLAPGKSSNSQTVTITNTGGSPADSLTLVATLPFSLVQDTCGASLAAGATCTTGVVFSPPLAMSYMGTLTVASGAQTLASVPLSGTGGTPGAVQVQPSQIGACPVSAPAANCFSQTSVGAASAPAMVTLTNPVEDVSLANFTVATTGSYQIVNSNCPSMLAAGASCIVGVEFEPASAGAQSGSLIVGSSALAVGATVPLSGMGFDFAVASSGASSATVASGQTALYDLVITPLGGSQGAFTLQCGSLPSYASCTFNPPGQSIAANATGSEMVQIATGVSSSARQSRPIGWPVLPLACVLVFMPSVFRRRRKALALIAVLAILAGGVSSCTSSGGGLAQPPIHSGVNVTPAGTYSIPVTVTSGGLQRQVTLSVTVD